MPDDNQSAPTQYGGQAVIEGVMMRSPRFYAVACRRENKEIVVQEESVESLLKRVRWLNKPFLRGTLAMIDALVLGMKSLTFSANVAMESAAKGETSTPAEQSPEKKQSINDIAISATLILGVLLGIGIFIVIPQLVVGQMERWIHRSVWLNVAAGGVKLTLFVGYIFVISRLKDIQRVFQYHGAEHKVINTFEAKEDLTPENFAKHDTIHPRCGTSFLLVVILISVVVFCFLGWSQTWYERVFLRLLVLPIVAGIAYEVIRFAGSRRDSWLLRILLAPGLWMQKLTTGEPTDDQIEVALCALEAVINKEREANASLGDENVRASSRA